MADRVNFFFEQILKENVLDDAFAQLETADWNQNTDLGFTGLISGGRVVPSGVAATCTVDPFVAYDNDGKRLKSSNFVVVNFTNDTGGTPTIPSAGHYRWISIVARYGKFGDDPQTDGDGDTVYFTQTEGISSTGDVDAATNPSHFGALRVLSGTESATINGAVRPSGLGQDVLIADLLLDDTGHVHGTTAGVSVARATRQVTRRSGAPAQSGDFDNALVKYVLLSEFAIEDSGRKVRHYLGQNGGPSYVITINAGWDGVTQLWSSDLFGQSGTLYEFRPGTLEIGASDSSLATWTDDRHNSLGWNSRMLLGPIVGGSDVSMTGTGRIVASGAQVAYATVYSWMYTADDSGTPHGTGWTWPQEMAANPSSVTFADLAGIDQNILAGPTLDEVNKYGGTFHVTNNITHSAVKCARKITAVP